MMEKTISKAYSLESLLQNKSIQVALSVTLLFIFAQIKVYTPLSPIPFTLQTFGIYLLANHLDSKTAFSSGVAYLLLGAFGLPMFTDFSSGLSVFQGMSAGYLLSFPLTLYWCSKRIEKGSNPLLSTFLGSQFILLCGTIGIYVLTSDFIMAISTGFLPFILVEALKAVTAQKLKLKL